MTNEMALLQHSKLFDLLCRISTNLEILPVIWNFKNFTLTFPKTLEFQKKFDRVCKNTNIHLLYMMIILCQVFYFRNCNFSSSSKFIDLVLYGRTVFGELETHAFMVTVLNEPIILRFYVNGIVQICRKTKPFRKSHNSLIRKLNFAFAYTLVPGCAVMHFIYIYGMHFISPCKPSLTGYKLIPECHSFENEFVAGFFHIWSLPIKLIILGLNFWALGLGVYMATFVVSGVITLCGQSF